MVTIERLLPYSYWIGHPVSNRALIYQFVGFVPLSPTVYSTLVFIIHLNNKKWERNFQRNVPVLTRRAI